MHDGSLASGLHTTAHYHYILKLDIPDYGRSHRRGRARPAR